VTAERDLSSTTLSVHPESVVQRTRRALVMSGITALIVGAVLGLFRPIHRSRYRVRIPAASDDRGSCWGGAIWLLGLIAGLELRGRTAYPLDGGDVCLIVGLIVSEMVCAGLGMSVSGRESDQGRRGTAELVGVAWPCPEPGRLAETQQPVPPTQEQSLRLPATPVIGWRRLNRPTKQRLDSSRERSSRRSSSRRTTPQVEPQRRRLP
jgi:hypothetical protein